MQSVYYFDIAAQNQNFAEAPIRCFSRRRACGCGASLIDKRRAGDQAGAFALVFDIGPRRQFA
jgi:hypothetical protein